MITQKQKMKMQQKLTPQQLMLMRLLQLPVTSLEQHIKEEVEKNPMLEIESGPDEIQENNEVDNDGDDFNGIDIDEYYEDEDYNYREQLEKDRNVEEHRIDPSEGTSFTEALLRQLRLRDIGDRDRVIAEEIIGSIDGSGYLGRDTQLIANDMAFRSGIDVSDDEVCAVLEVIQTFDPAGVGARNLQECLSLQLARMDQSDEDIRLATVIVKKHFSQLTNKHYSSLMIVLKVDEARLNRALAVIRRLNPKPGWGREEENKGAHYIIPDFIVSREGGQLNFTLSDRNRPPLKLNSEYTEMMQQLSNRKQLSSSERETLQFIKNKTEVAQGLIDSIQQRGQTLYTVMAAILRHQSAYFLSGDSHDLRPMRLKDIAAATGFDESTVSRVANQKYVQTDFGTFLLKELFSKAAVTDSGDIIVADHVKNALMQAVDNEDKRKPLTDEALTRILNEQGFKLSRRTVTKYREKLNIPVGRLRKEL
ncbi:MAG: RNA polymerase factor sigma-54 [Bacteroidales bacterium]|nr:RNA polymerase factor sigma-54 [Bacteroidales bacterium]